MVTVGRKHRGPKGGGKQRKEEARSAVKEKAYIQPEPDVGGREQIQDKTLPLTVNLC